MHEITGFLHYMFLPKGAPWYSGAFWSNQTQWTVVWLPTLIMIYRHHKCSACWRLSKHSVKGTHYRTCPKHTTPYHHNRLTRRHATKYPTQHEFLRVVGGDK